MAMNRKEAKRGNDITCTHSIVMILYRCLPVLTERLKMDRRRLEPAHFRFAIIQVSTWYTDLTLDGVVFNEEAVALTEFTTIG